MFLAAPWKRRGATPTIRSSTSLTRTVRPIALVAPPYSRLAAVSVITSVRSGASEAWRGKPSAAQGRTPAGGEQIGGAYLARPKLGTPLVVAKVHSSPLQPR